MDAQHLQDVQSSAKLLFKENAIQTQLDQLCEQINLDYTEKTPIVLCVLIGGLYTFSQILARLHVPLQIDYVHASRYNSGTCGQTLQWKAKPTSNFDGRHILVIDDILDGGLTLQGIVDYCKNKGAASTQSAVLLNKKNARIPGGLKTADYTALTLESNDYVFGCGMDYKTYLRNTPNIYAVHPTLLDAQKN